jgi:putative addiction module killer protein
LCHLWHSKEESILRLYVILRTTEFIEWFEEQSIRDQSSIDLRISRIENHAYLGDFKYLSDGLLELRWKNGRRIYFTKLENENIFLLLGGFKNAQKKDIKKARLLIKRYERD